MKPQDARSLSPDALFDLRTRVVAAVGGGMSQVEAARVFAVHRSAVNRWCQAGDAPDALRADDPRLTQGSTTTPPPLMAVQDWECEAACPIGICSWLGEGLRTVGDVESAFAAACYEAERRLGQPGSTKCFLNWADNTPRPEMIQSLLEEVELALQNRVIIA